MHVVATAGHVDHGKSTLVRALTGSDPDRLAEERRRGLTIELGYAWTRLDELDDRVGDGEVAFVDVPGHERFLATALSGVGPVMVAMLVVAADDPWMPQTAEHLAILDALGVSHGLVAVSRSDLADPAAAIARTRAELARTGLADAPVVPVSAQTGAGLDDLRAVLARVLAAAPTPDPAADVRLWVDRRFHVRGAGTVVTGTLPAGTVRPGDALVAPDGQEVRVRGVQALGRDRDEVSGPARVALDLGGRAPESLQRGTPLLTPGAFAPTTTLDVAVAGADALPQRPQLHVGSTQVGVHARPLGTSYARLTLATPLPFRVGDRAVLRDPGDRTVWGMRVVDPAPPGLRRRGAAAARANTLSGLDGTLATDLPVRGIARAADLRRIGVGGPLPADALEAAGWLVADVAVRRRALEALVPDGIELSLAEATQGLGLPDPAITEALVAPPLEYAGGRIRRAGAGLSPAAERALAWLHARLVGQPFAAPTADDLRDAGVDAGVVAELHRGGQALRLAQGVVVLPEAADLAADRLAELPQPFTTSQARQALGTSRRVVLPLLAHLDATRRTVRLPDDTRRVNAGRTGSPAAGR